MDQELRNSRDWKQDRRILEASQIHRRQLRYLLGLVLSVIGGAILGCCILLPYSAVWDDSGGGQMVFGAFAGLLSYNAVRLMRRYRKD